MKKSDLKRMPEFFDRYINLVEDIEIVQALEQCPRFEKIIDYDLLRKLDGKRYAPGKWTIKDIIQHIIDNERIQTYRALRFARTDTTPLPGYNEELLGATSQAESRSLDELLNEFHIVRQSSITLFKSFDDAMLLREGVCFEKTVSVLSVGFMLAGHLIHHANVIRDRYLPLIK